MGTERGLLLFASSDKPCLEGLARGLETLGVDEALEGLDGGVRRGDPSVAL